MKCPCCSTEAKSLVKETRQMNGDIARRRECTECGKTFTTREYFDPDFVLYKPRPPREDRRHSNNNDLFRVWGKA